MKCGEYVMDGIYFNSLFLVGQLELCYLDDWHAYGLGQSPQWWYWEGAH